jgi:hypothetical protein
MKTTELYLFLLVSTSVMVSSCGDKYDVSSYYNRSEQDSLLADIITYIYVRAPYAEWDTRFEPKFRKYYVSQLRDFKFDRYYRDEKGTHYYYIIRPARSAEGNIRGVGGKFSLNASGKIVSFEEMFNTPVASLVDLQNRGRELFARMIKSGNVDDYLSHPDYIEWPDEMTYYDTLKHEWLIKPGI